ncbi:MAG TPA: hypothetical protein VII75_10830 [Thermoanaerobaculia bacterium]
MTRLVLITVIVFALALAVLADDLTRRLEPLAPSGSRIIAAVFDEYPSGRPRRVVATFGNSVEGTLLLFLFPDSARGAPRILDRETLESGPGEIRLEKVIDAKDVVVSLFIRHGTTDIVDRVIADRLVRIADDYGEAIDLDGDGVPEIIASSYAGRNRCGVVPFVYLGRWNGKRYVSDGRRYVTVLSRGTGTDTDELLLSASKHYVVRIFGRGRVTLDDDSVAPGKRFRTNEDCHTIALHDSDARTRAFIEELP